MIFFGFDNDSDKLADQISANATIDRSNICVVQLYENRSYHFFYFMDFSVLK